MHTFVGGKERVNPHSKHRGLHYADTVNAFRDVLRDRDQRTAKFFDENWIELAPGSRRILARFSYGDWANEAAGELPSEFQCAQWIRTPNDDKNETSLSLLDVTLNAPARIFVGFDDRAVNPPDWITTQFVDTGLAIDITEAGTQ